MLSQERGSHSQPSQHMRKKPDPFARANTAIQYSGLEVLTGYGMPKITNQDYKIDCCLCSPSVPSSRSPEREEYIALAQNFTVRSKMRPQKMELWNEFLPDQLKVESTTDIPKVHIPKFRVLNWHLPPFYFVQD